MAVFTGYSEQNSSQMSGVCLGGRWADNIMSTEYRLIVSTNTGCKESHFYSLPCRQAEATTTCKNDETLPRKKDLSCFKSLLITGLWDIILTSLLPPIQSCSSKFWVWSCIASNFDKGWRGDHKHKIMDRPFIAKYSVQCLNCFCSWL